MSSDLLLDLNSLVPDGKGNGLLRLMRVVRSLVHLEVGEELPPELHSEGAADGSQERTDRMRIIFSYDMQIYSEESILRRYFSSIKVKQNKN